MELFALKQRVLLGADFLSVSSGFRVNDPGWGWTDFKIYDIWMFCFLPLMTGFHSTVSDTWIHAPGWD